MSQIDSPKSVREGEELNIEKIGNYLRGNLPGMEGEISVKQFPSGFSNLTYMVTVGEKEYVLRRPPFGTKAKSAHDMKREYHILSSIKGSFEYVPDTLIYCEDEEVLGSPFYVMERIKGIILRKELPEGLFADELRIKALCRNWVEVLCDLHKMDYAKCGLTDLGKPEGYVERQVTGWSKRYRNARTEDVPDFKKVMGWLAENMPDDHPNPALIHNDYKFDNVFLNPDEPTHITGVVDWEMATIGDPLMDLGASLAYWVNHDDSDEMKMVATIPTASPGMLKRDDIVNLYEEISGQKIENFEFYYCFGIFRLAAIAQQIYYRYYNGQTKDERFKMIPFFVQVLEKAASDVMLTGKY
jgi:aminoglycoside phosphotransferase (APT) family kinase protein